MRRYLVRRLLLMPPTLFGIMLIAFVLTRLVPGGPLEQAMSEARAAKEERGSKGGPPAGGSDALSPEETQKLKELYGLDRPGIPAFFEWLGVLPKNLPNGSSVVFTGGESGTATVTLSAPTPTDRDDPFRFDATVALKDGVPALTLPADLPAQFDRWKAKRAADVAEGSSRGGKAAKAAEEHLSEEFEYAGTALRPWHVAIMRIEDERPGFAATLGRLFALRYKPAEPGKAVTVKVFQRGYAGVLEGDFGMSFLQGRPALALIVECAPKSAWLGVLSLIFTYLIAIPLGVAKAVRHGGFADGFTSFLLFFAAAIPGYIVATMLLQVFAHKLHWFPTLRLLSDDFDAMSPAGKTLDLLHHTVLPLVALTIGQLALMAMLMKNSLLDNLGADYVRTAIAKGVPFRRAVSRHAFRLSLVPIATGFGNCVGVLMTGSFLIETIFDINGYGLLGYRSLVGRDYPVFLAGLVIASVLMLLGNLISDICVALVDPRIRFDK